MSDLRSATAAQTRYRKARVDGPGIDPIAQGVHGVVIYLIRAKTVSVGGKQAGVHRAQHMAEADRLLVFLSRLVDTHTELGSSLTHCYTGIQRLIAQALAHAPEEGADALDSAIQQARELERQLAELTRGSMS